MGITQYTPKIAKTHDCKYRSDYIRIEKTDTGYWRLIQTKPYYADLAGIIKFPVCKEDLN